MKRVGWTAAVLIVLTAAADTVAGTIEATVGLMIRESNGHPYSAGQAVYRNALGHESWLQIDISHVIRNTDASNYGLFWNPYNQAIEASSPAGPPNCYKAMLTGRYDDVNDSDETSEICYQGPAPPVEGGWNVNDPTCGDPGMCSPILFNLGQGTYTLTSVEGGVLFDLGGTGTPLRTSWTAAGAPLGFLALDRNGNGRIDSGAELFGNATRLSSGQVAPNGFVALAELDRNRDGVIDDSDPVWSALLIWTDLSHNGVSEPEELQSPAARGIHRIDLQHHFSGRVDQYGNAFRYQGKVSLGSTARPFYDIWFRTR